MYAVKIHIKGRFRVVKDLHLRFPRWGHVDDSVPASINHGGDKVYHRLGPLLADNPEIDDPSKPRLLRLIAINAADSKAPREADYIGPIEASDVDNVAEFMAYLEKTPYQRITIAISSDLVKSANPWLAWLGLLRLDELKALSAVHFENALRCRAGADFESIYNEMVYSGTCAAPYLKSLPSVALSDNVHPKLQKAAMQKILSLYEAESNVGKRPIDTHININRLQEAVRAYRPKAAADPRRGELVVYLDRILRLQ